MFHVAHDTKIGGMEHPVPPLSNELVPASCRTVNCDYAVAFSWSMNVGT